MSKKSYLEKFSLGILLAGSVWYFVLVLLTKIPNANIQFVEKLYKETALNAVIVGCIGLFVFLSIKVYDYFKNYRIKSRQEYEARSKKSVIQQAEDQLGESLNEMFELGESFNEMFEEYQQEFYRAFVSMNRVVDPSAFTDPEVQRNMSQEKNTTKKKVEKLKKVRRSDIVRGQ